MKNIVFKNILGIGSANGIRDVERSVWNIKVIRPLALRPRKNKGSKRELLTKVTDINLD